MADQRLLQAVNRLREQNPMLGLRGVRLGLVIPELFTMQVRALAEAVAERTHAGGDPRAEIMVPLVGTARELQVIRDRSPFRVPVARLEAARAGLRSVHAEGSGQG